MVSLELYSKKLGKVGTKSGLNWCHANANVNQQDAYIAITKQFIKENVNFFPEHGSVIHVKWDDGTEMSCLMEGKQKIDNQVFYKQISSYNDKSVLGTYLRNRLNVSVDEVISLEDLQRYGRTNIDVIKVNDKDFKFDFSI